MATPFSYFNLAAAHPSWRPCIQEGLSSMAPDYLHRLSRSTTWLPGSEKIFNAFSLPLDQVEHVLFGESPYPRKASANGYAFWDAAVQDIWSEKGLSKPINRATSLRNFVKMLLIAEGALRPGHTSPEDISKVNKTGYIKTNQALFQNLLHHGFLLLNATLALQENSPVSQNAKAWQPFMAHVLHVLYQKKPNASLILFGNVANKIMPLLKAPPPRLLYAEHPYNLSFITAPKVLSFFKPFHLLLER